MVKQRKVLLAAQTAFLDWNGLTKNHRSIEAFYNITGIPMLLNTSFNCQEPMVKTPEDAINTFNKTDLDMLVINDWIIKKD